MPYLHTFESSLGPEWELSPGATGSITFVDGSNVLEVLGGSATVGVDTTGCSDVYVAFRLGAQSLESGESCNVEVQAGEFGEWQLLFSLGNGEDDGTLRVYSGYTSPTNPLPAAFEDNPSVFFRLRLLGGATGDRCYLDDLLWNGTVGGISPGPKPWVSVDGHRHSSSSSSSNSELTEPLQLAPAFMGQSSSARLTIGNDGTADLNLSLLPAHPLEPSDMPSAFSISQDSCHGNTVPPGSSCHLVLTFAPSFPTGSSQRSPVGLEGYVRNALLAYHGVNAHEGTALSGGPARALQLLLQAEAVPPPSSSFSPPPPFDPLSGNGSLYPQRTRLTSSDLQSLSAAGVLEQFDSFRLPVDAATPRHEFTGRLELYETSTTGNFEELKDDFQYANNADSPIKHLPPFNYSFVAQGSWVVPVSRGSLPSEHENWEWVLQPGRAWTEATDFVLGSPSDALTRVSLPFALQQRNANCIHQGVLTFLFGDSGIKGKVAYQIASEVCYYFQFNMWGRLQASFTADWRPSASSPRAVSLLHRYARLVSARLPTRPLSSLSGDFEERGVAVDGTRLGTDVSSTSLSKAGLVLEGWHYTGGCPTRYGEYPHCPELVLPSYSLAKSIFAGAGLMALQRLTEGAAGFNSTTSVSDLVPSCAVSGSWSDVTLEDLSDMATGNFGSSTYMLDEGALHTNNLFLTDTHSEKISYACGYYERKVAPGMTWIYHTSDTYILGTALQKAYSTFVSGRQQQDLSALLELSPQSPSSDLPSTAFHSLYWSRDVFNGLLLTHAYASTPLSALFTHGTRRTYDSTGQPFAGWGLLLTADDLAQLLRFLNDFSGRAGNAGEGGPLLDPVLLAAAMQANPVDRGLQPSSNTNLKYNNGFWAKDAGQILDPASATPICSSPLWIPFFSGYGGISAALLPSGVNYFQFSDGGEYSWDLAATELKKLAPLCSEDMNDPNLVVTCPPPLLAAGMAGSCPSRNVGDLCGPPQVTCGEGFEGMVSTVRCQGTGGWSGSLSGCWAQSPTSSPSKSSLPSLTITKTPSITTSPSVTPSATSSTSSSASPSFPPSYTSSPTLSRTSSRSPSHSLSPSFSPPHAPFPSQSSPLSPSSTSSCFPSPFPSPLPSSNSSFTLSSSLSPSEMPSPTSSLSGPSFLSTLSPSLFLTLSGTVSPAFFSSSSVSISPTSSPSCLPPSASSLLPSLSSSPSSAHRVTVSPSFSSTSSPYLLASTSSPVGIPASFSSFPSSSPSPSVSLSHTRSTSSSPSDSSGEDATSLGPRLNEGEGEGSVVTISPSLKQEGEEGKGEGESGQGSPQETPEGRGMKPKAIIGLSFGLFFFLVVCFYAYDLVCGGLHSIQPRATSTGKQPQRKWWWREREIRKKRRVTRQRINDEEDERVGAENGVELGFQDISYGDLPFGKDERRNSSPTSLSVSEGRIEEDTALALSKQPSLLHPGGVAGASTAPPPLGQIRACPSLLPPPDRDLVSVHISPRSQGKGKTPRGTAFLFK